MNEDAAEHPDDALVRLGRAALKRLIDDPDAELTAAEEAMLRAAGRGEVADCATEPGDDRDPANARDWPQRRTIRPKLLEWLCVDREAREHVAHRGVRVRWARICGDVELADAWIGFPIGLCDCRIFGAIDLLRARMRTVALRGSWVGPSCQPEWVVAFRADGAMIDGTLHFDHGFRGVGECRLPGAKIVGDLSFVDGEFVHPHADSTPDAMGLNCDGVRVDGSILLRDGFSATGGVRFLAASISQEASLGGARFQHPLGVALQLQNATVGTSLVFDNMTRFVGKLSLSHLSVSVLADTRKACRRIAPSRLQLDALAYAAIAPGSPTDAKTRIAWLARALPVVPRVCWTRVCGRFGRLWRDTLRLRACGTWSRLFDGIRRACHGSRGEVEHALQCWRERRRELEKVRRNRPPSPQPYRQLAKVLRSQGHAGEARKVLLAGEDVRRKLATPSAMMRALLLFFRWTVGCGHRMRYAIAWLLFFVLLGFLALSSGADAGLMVPSNPRVYMDASWAVGGVPAEYPRFDPLVYSLDSFVPLVDLHQEAYWLPRSDGGRGSALCWYLRCHIVCGWLLTAFVAAGITARLRTRFTGDG